MSSTDELKWLRISKKTHYFYHQLWDEASSGCSYIFNLDSVQMFVLLCTTQRDETFTCCMTM